MPNFGTRIRFEIRRIASAIRPHAFGIAVAFSVGAIMILPQVAFRIWMGSAYRGIAMVQVNDVTDKAWYTASVKEAMEGGDPWNAVLSESKGVRYPNPDLAERIMALPGRALPVDIDSVMLWWCFFLPFILSLVIYAVGIRLTKSRGFAAVASLIVMCATPFLHDPRVAISSLAGTGAPYLFTLFDRPVHPQFEAPFVLLFFLSAFLAGQHPTRRRYWIAAGVILGYLTHSYFWAWTWGYAALAMLLVLAGIRKDGAAVRATLKTWLVGIVIGLPQLLALGSSLFGSKDVAFAERMGLLIGDVPGILSRLVLWLLWLPVAATVAFVLVRRKVSPPQRVFIVAGLGASVIAVVQQVMTRVAFNPDHYALLIGSAFSSWVMVFCAWTALRDSSRRVRVSVASAACILAVAVMIGLQVRMFVQNRGEAASLQSFADVASWLDAHASPGAVVYSDTNAGLLTLIHSDADLWWNLYAVSVPSTEEERIMRAADVWFLLHGVTADGVRQLARERPSDLAGLYTTNNVYEYRISLVHRDLDRWVASYQAFLDTTDLADALRRYRIDYILVDSASDRWDPAVFEVMDPVVRNERFGLYPIRPKGP